MHDSTITENSFDIGSGTLNTTELFNTVNKFEKVQYLITATELQNQGLIAGDISKLSFDIQNQGEILKSVIIKMKLTTLPELTDSTFEYDNFTLVYNNLLAQQPLGITTYNFLLRLLIYMVTIHLRLLSHKPGYFLSMFSHGSGINCLIPKDIFLSSLSRVNTMASTSSPTLRKSFA